MIRCIDETKRFPDCCKVAKLALLPKRTIFYLDFLAKIVEDVMNISLRETLPKECEGQFAYQTDRSTDLCVAIGLHRAEISDENCINLDYDCKKTFDRTYWVTLLERI